MKNTLLLGILFVIIAVISLGCRDKTDLKELSGNNPVVTSIALDRLNQQGDEAQASIPVLIRLINSPATSVSLKKKGIRTLGAVAEDENCLALGTFLNDDNKEIVKTVIIAVAQTGYDPLAEKIRPLLKDPEFRNYAIWCLGQLGNSEDVSRIAPFLNHKNDTAFVAYKALLLF
ncbi:MAG: hypothetical protein R6U68_08970 [Desulfobacteraceae bacterium]